MYPLNENALAKWDSKELVESLSTLNRIFKSLETVNDLREAFKETANSLSMLIPSKSFYAGLYKEKFNTVEWLFANDKSTRLRQALKPAEDEIISLAIFRKETVYTNLNENKIFSLNQYDKVCLNDQRISSHEACLISPIVVRNNTVGLISLRSQDRNSFTDSHAYLISIVSSQIGLVLEKSELVSQLAEKEKLQSVVELASSVGHELNQPLTGITGYCALIKEDIPENDAIYKDIVEIEKQAERLEKLVFKFQNLLQLENSSDENEVE